MELMPGYEEETHLMKAGRVKKRGVQDLEGKVVFPGLNP